MMNWILLRGLARETRHWESFPDIFKKTLGAAKVIALDLPGAGQENRNAAPTTVSEIVDDIRSRFLKQTQVNEKWNVLSISLGGMITLDWCAKYPQDFEKAVLINCSARKICSLFERLTPYALQTLGQALLSPSATLREKLILSATTTFNRDNEVLAKRWSEYSHEFKVTSLNLARQLWAAAHFEPPQKIENTEMLFLNSAGDRFVSPICSYKLSKHYESTLKTHPNAGHDLALDDPEWVSKTVKDWLEQSASRVGSSPTLSAQL